ncbi:FAD-binding oxidoreductase [Candidatus Saccharibacteria bacterium]|nr:FAD-binding oxidoreductase [Candidatus Saccharibacteria bacterium]
MSKIAHYLQEHLTGEVSASPEVRRHFAHDASILRQAPAIVVYPRGESDVRKTSSFCWQLAERRRPVSITARGGGSDTSGAAIGSGIMVVFPAHMNKILELDPKKQQIIVEPGATYDKIEQTLYTHGLFLPSYPASQQYATIGGGIANNAIGEKSVKYGATGDYVQRLRVVLANGEVIETGPLHRRELNRKLGMSTLEGEIYRIIDKMIEENGQLIASLPGIIKARRNSVGYNLAAVKTKKGFDLTPLFVGSQGTLGIITEATLKVIPHNPITNLALVSFDKMEDFHDALPRILELKPSIYDMVNKATIEQVVKINPHQLDGVMPVPNAAIHLFIEFDEEKGADQKKSIRKLGKILERSGTDWVLADNLEDQQKIRKVRESVATILTEPSGQTKAVPVAEDVAVPVENLVDFLRQVNDIYTAAGMRPAIWGSAGDGVVRMHPMLDLSQTGDRQRLFKLADAIYAAALKLGGTVSASHGEGRVRAPYSVYMYGEKAMGLMREVKKAFEPHNILNAGVKTATREEIKALLRGDYSQAHRHEHLPRS